MILITVTVHLYVGLSIVLNISK